MMRDIGKAYPTFPRLTNADFPAHGSWVQDEKATSERWTM
jgi:hypothetical protein